MPPPSLACPACAVAIPLPARGAWLGPALACDGCGWQPARQDGFPLLAPDIAETGSDFDPSAFDRLTATEAWHFWFAPRARLLARLVARHFPDAAHFLEIGCGGGYVTRAIAASRPWTRVVGGEASAQGLRHAMSGLPPAMELTQLDARCLPFRAAFDVIGCFDVLEHITEDTAVLKGIRAALRPGGGIVLAVPQHRWLWSAADTHAQHKRRYARGQLEAQCRAVGLEVVESLSYATITLPLMLASRLMARGGSDAEGAAGEMTPPRLLNAGLRAALQAEVTLSLAGLRLPVGGSRVVVARLPASARPH